MGWQKHTSQHACMKCMSHTTAGELSDRHCSRHAAATHRHWPLKHRYPGVQQSLFFSQPNLSFWMHCSTKVQGCPEGLRVLGAMQPGHAAAANHGYA